MQWDIILAIAIPGVGVIAGFGGIKQWQKDHEVLDAARFEAIQDTLKEIRQDVKDLLKGAHET